MTRLIARGMTALALTAGAVAATVAIPAAANATTLVTFVDPITGCTHTVSVYNPISSIPPPVYSDHGPVTVTDTCN